eukprot:6183401-Pleurochrysis_carterae.AAC.1
MGAATTEEHRLTGERDAEGATTTEEHRLTGERDAEVQGLEAGRWERIQTLGTNRPQDPPLEEGASLTGAKTGRTETGEGPGKQ